LTPPGRVPDVLVGLPVTSAGVVIGGGGAPNTTSGTAVSLMVGQSAVDALLDDVNTERWFRYDVRAGRSYCVEAAAQPNEHIGTLDPAATVYASNATTVLGSNDTAAGEAPGLTNARVCYAPTVSEVNFVKVTDAPAGALAYAVRVVETTLFSNWFFIGGDYSAYTLIRNTSDVAVTFTVNWRDLAGNLVGIAPGVLSAHGDMFFDARTVVGLGGAIQGSVEVAHGGPPDAVVGSTTVLSPTTGLSFDAPFQARQPW
jgi:hypothetical protein